MADDSLVEARKRAERAIEGMPEGPLKIAAFQTILTKLLSDSSAEERIRRVPGKATVKRGGQTGTAAERILAIGSEGFFKTQRSLGEVRAALGSRGWHYPVTTLSGVMQSLVRQRQLRRERVTVGGKQMWKYSNP